MPSGKIYIGFAFNGKKKTAGFVPDVVQKNKRHTVEPYIKTAKTQKAVEDIRFTVKITGWCVFPKGSFRFLIYGVVSFRKEKK